MSCWPTPRNPPTPTIAAEILPDLSVISSLMLPSFSFDSL